MDKSDLVSTTTSAAAANSSELRGPVLEVLHELLSDRRDDDVIELVTKLVARNHELELLLGKMRESKNRAERISSTQLDLFLDKLREQSEGELKRANDQLEQTAKANAGRTEPDKPAKQPALRRPPPPQLRRVDNPIAVPPEQRDCPVCGAQRKCIGHETTEVVDLIPAEVIVRRDRREVVACDVCDAQMDRAPMGDKVIEGGAYGSRLVSFMLVSKYWDGLPLNRISDYFERLGLSIPSSSMSDQITWATDLVRPIWRHLMRAVLGAIVLHADATWLAVKDKDSMTGIVTGALWGYVGDTDKAVYLYTSTGKKLGQRAGEVGPEEFLAMRRGPIVADASNLFDATFESGERIEVGCNMHARRYFKKALDANDLRASVPLAAFKTLYDVEDGASEMAPQARRAERQRRSKPVYDQLLEWCQTHLALEPPSSLLGRAIQYLNNHRVALTRFLDDGRLPIDNGIVERLHRRPAMGRRSFLFAGSHAAGERAAIAYSVLATCSLLEINPLDYLTDILPKLARGVFKDHDLAMMTPAAWKAAKLVAKQDDPVAT